MTNPLDFLQSGPLTFDVRSALDIVIVAFIIYSLLMLFKGTTADALLRGIVVVFLVGTAASKLLGLTVLGWLLSQAIQLLLFAILVLFAPEIRRVLEQVGRARGPSRTTLAATSDRTIDTIAAAAGILAERRWGAILVIERQIPSGSTPARAFASTAPFLSSSS
jgi:diadenylate cyclase